jgi:hypothetical protein
MTNVSSSNDVPTPEVPPSSSGQRSVIYSAAFVLGMLITVAGAVAALVGLGKSSSIEIDAFDVSLKTTSVGLGVMFLGMVMMVLLAKFKPKDVLLYAEAAKVVRKPIFLEHLITWFGESWHAVAAVLILLALFGVSLGVTQ